MRKFKVCDISHKVDEGKSEGKSVGERLIKSYQFEDELAILFLNLTSGLNSR